MKITSSCGQFFDEKNELMRLTFCAINEKSELTRRVSVLPRKKSELRLNIYLQ
jgi:hypothetical protein